MPRANGRNNQTNGCRAMGGMGRGMGGRGLCNNPDNSFGTGQGAGQGLKMRGQCIMNPQGNDATSNTGLGSDTNLGLGRRAQGFMQSIGRCFRTEAMSQEPRPQKPQQSSIEQDK